jgi:hypothetical protein
MGGTMPLIWGFDQRHRRAADWHDGQFADGKHAPIACRALTLPSLACGERDDARTGDLTPSAEPATAGSP